MGTLVRLRVSPTRLADTLRDEHGVDVDEAGAERALAAEIGYYRAHHDEGRDPASLADLRVRCAAALRDGLGPGARALDAASLVPGLLGALRFESYDDAAPALARLREAGLRLAVASNWDVSLHDVLRVLGLEAAVDAVVASAEVGASKPDPRVLRAALDRLGVAAGEAVHVGDSAEHDVRAAERAGVGAVLLARPPARRTGSVGEVPVIGSLDELSVLAA